MAGPRRRPDPKRTEAGSRAAGASGDGPDRGRAGPIGVYVHVPFCSTRCDYCAFATWTDRAHLMHHYAEACMAELAAVVAAGMPPATSVFFGGGTPSLLPSDLLRAILDEVPRREGAEITVECNPDDAAVELFEDYRRAGVNRLSFGAQSMQPAVLAGLGRRHGPQEVGRAVALAREAGFDNFNLDLIYGAAGESDADWAATLETVLALDPPHISAYALSVEPGTHLAMDPSRHPDDDVQAHRYRVADSLLSAAGLCWYEVSNWARPGYECRHNSLYWSQGDYRGIGAAAHSHSGRRRWWNVRTPQRYIEAVSEGRSPVAGEEILDERQLALERLWLRLRTREGIPASTLADDGALDGLVDREGEVATLTLSGRLLANEVAARIEPAAP